MLWSVLRVLGVAGLAAAALASPADAGVTRIDGCTTLDKPGETYVLTRDVGPGLPGLACFAILANRVTLDLNGHTITGPGGGGLGVVTDVGVGTDSTVVKNGTFREAGFVIFLRRSSRVTVRDVTVVGLGPDVANAAPIVSVGPNSLVKDCIVQRSAGDGIVVGEGSQVEGCLVGGTAEGDGNHRVGILGEGAGRVLVTRNTVIGNGFGPIFGQPPGVGFAGIQVGARSTVTNNAVSDNGGDGINVGAGSLVTNNTSNDNGGDGVEAVCPSTITNNEVSGNDGAPINPVGAGCFVKGNFVVVGPPE